LNNELLELIDAFIENELALASYYAACHDKFAESSDKWKILQREEENHAEIFRKIKESIEKHPDQWRAGNFALQTVRLVSKSVRDKIDELKMGKLNSRYAINFIVDVEQSLIESNISRSFNTELPEFREMLLNVQTETVGHKNLLISLRP